ncbi:DUF3114 domain-containing protein [Mogibacterium sp.]
MSASFYLDPAEIKAQCREAIDNLNEVSSKTINVEHKLDEFINNSELESKAFDALKQQIADYKTVLQSIRSLIKYNISEYKTLMSSVGDKVLDGDKILKGQEYARGRIRAYEDRANRCRENAVTYAAIAVYAENQSTRASLYDHLADNHRRMLEIWEEQEQAYYDIENATKDLFSTGDSTAEQINAALSDLGRSFRAGAFHPNLEASWRAKLKEEAKELDVINMFGIKRPKSIDDKTWEKYQEGVTAKVLLLEKQGWPIESIKEFGKYFKEMLGRKGQSSDMSEIVASCYSDTQIVGTKAFDNMWYAWKADRISASESKKKLYALMKITGMDKLDEKSSADQLRAVADKINKRMKPDDKFWGSLAGTVEKAYYPSGMKGDLGKQLHLFRYVISYQQAKYIVDNYKGRTDEEKLINYIVKEKIWNWTAEESTRLHLKSYYDQQTDTYIYPDGHSTANGGINLKVVTNARFRSEFIINGDGKFLTLLDKDATQDAKVNCSSFNYARRNDDVHRVLDVEPANPNYELQFREEAKNVLDNSGNQVKDSNGKSAVFTAPEHKDMWGYKDSIKKRQTSFRNEVFACIKQ